MARPSNLCKLRHGKALAAFPTFVETFNWLVDFCANLIGDAEESGQTGSGGGSITVDRKQSDRPVIRFAGSGSGESGSVKLIGNDGTSVDNVKSITFASGDDSNINVSVSGGDEEGSAIVKIDMYYR